MLLHRNRDTRLVIFLSLIVIASIFLYRITDDYVLTRATQGIFASVAIISLFAIRKERDIYLTWFFFLCLISMLWLLSAIILERISFQVLMMILSPLNAILLLRFILYNGSTAYRIISAASLVTALYILIYIYIFSTNPNDLFRGSRNHLGTFGVILIVLHLIALLKVKSYKQMLPATFWLPTLLWILILFFNTGRAGLVIGGAFFTLLLFLFLNFTRKNKVKFVNYIVMAVVVISILISVFFFGAFDGLDDTLLKSYGLNSFGAKGLASPRHLINLHWFEHLVKGEYFFGYPLNYFKDVFTITSHNSFIRIHELLGFAGLMIFVISNIYFSIVLFKVNKILFYIFLILQLKLSVDTVITSFDFMLVYFMVVFSGFIHIDQKRKYFI
jgi:hypothetical protein